MTKDYTHLDALELRLARERMRLADAKTAQEKALRRAWVAQYAKEVAEERKFLGLDDAGQSVGTMTDDELAAELSKKD